MVARGPVVSGFCLGRQLTEHGVLSRVLPVVPAPSPKVRDLNQTVSWGVFCNEVMWRVARIIFVNVFYTRRKDRVSTHDTDDGWQGLI